MSTVPLFVNIALLDLELGYDVKVTGQGAFGPNVIS